MSDLSESSLASSGDVNRALPLFAQTVGEAEAHYNVGYILYEKGDATGAERQFLAAVLKKPGLESAVTSCGRAVPSTCTAAGQSRFMPSVQSKEMVMNSAA